MVSSLHSREFIIDANVLFSCLISGKEFYLRLLADNRLFTADFALEEIQIYQERILTRSKLSPEQLSRFVLDVFSRLTIVPNLLVTTQSYYQAFLLCRDIDPKDTPYVALYLQLNIPLLTRDKPLAQGLRKQGFTNIVILDELLSQTNETDSTSYLQ